MTNENLIARLAGLLYLITVVAGVFRLIYVPAQIMVPDDMPATIHHIAQSLVLFRSGIACALIEQIAFLFLALLLYRLLSGAGKQAAVLMVILVAMSVPVALATEIHPLDVLALITPEHHGQGYSPEQLALLVKQSFDAYDHGLLIAELFWGLWLLPFGYLVLKSDVVPRVLGGFLIVGGLGYVIEVFGSILFANYSQTALSNYVTLPAAIGEIGTCLWLLAVGVNRPAGDEIHGHRSFSD